MSPHRFLVLVLASACTPAQAVETGTPKTVVPGAKLVEIFADERFFEGPTWDPKTNALFFTAFDTNTQVLRLTGPGKAAVWLDHSDGVNGTFLGLDGRLLGAQAYGHRIVSYAIDATGPGDPKVLYENPKLNQPNDLCQAPNGDIYFTDPDFAKHATSGVYRLANGSAVKVIDDLPLPNGIKTSLDGKTLYVSDSHLKLWKSYPIQPDGSLAAGTVFFKPDTKNQNDPDGLTIDEQGNLYCTGRGGVWAVAPDGTSLGLIKVPEFCSNVTFGGKDGKTLYLTCAKKVYSLRMTVAGGRPKH